jgi:hypothetical protein
MDLETLLARAELADVLARYVRAADRGDWDLLRTCYHDDAYDDHGEYKGGPDGLVVHVRAVAAQLMFTTHQLGQQLVEVDLPKDRARAETYCLAWYGRRSPASGRDWSIAQGLRYLDVFERRAGLWAIASRKVVMDWEHTFAVTHPPRLDAWLRGGPGPADPSWSFMPPGRDAGPW